MELKVLSGRNAGKLIHLPFGCTVIGRAASCNIRLKNPDVGQEHCQFNVVRHEVMLQDLASPGGTWLNGVKLVTPVRLCQGDVIRIETCEFEFQEGLLPSDTQKSDIRNVGDFPNDDTWSSEVASWLDDADELERARLADAPTRSIYWAPSRPIESVCGMVTTLSQQVQPIPPVRPVPWHRRFRKGALEMKTYGKLPVRPSERYVDTSAAAQAAIRKMMGR